MRVGIYAGTFDPVHSGHLAFALQALVAADLDRVIFLPERQPRAKPNSEHFGHRVAMLNKAVAPHPQFKVMELVDVNFNMQRTLTFLKHTFKNDDLIYLFGSDVALNLSGWHGVDKLLQHGEIVIGLRSEHDRHEIHEAVEKWPVPPKSILIIESYAPEVSSGQVRDALRSGQSTRGLLKSVERYSNHHWLYVKLDQG